MAGKNSNGTHVKFFNYVSLITLILVLLLVGFYIVSSCYPFEPLTVPQSKVHIINVNKTVQVGQPIILDLSGQVKNMAIAGEVTIKWIDTIVYTQPSYVSNRPTGELNQSLYLNVPNIPEGKYYLRFVIAFRINAFRTVTVVFETEDFEVVK